MAAWMIDDFLEIWLDDNPLSMYVWIPGIIRMVEWDSGDGSNRIELFRGWYAWLIGWKRWMGKYAVRSAFPGSRIPSLAVFDAWFWWAKNCANINPWLIEEEDVDWIVFEHINIIR